MGARAGAETHRKRRRANIKDVGHLIEEGATQGPQKMTKADVLLAKHKEFEAAAARMKGARRSIVKIRGVKHHLVEGATTGVIRWPVSYGTGPPKVRYEPLPVPDADSEVVAHLRNELGL